MIPIPLFYVISDQPNLGIYLRGTHKLYGFLFQNVPQTAFLPYHKPTPLSTIYPNQVQSTQRH